MTIKDWPEGERPREKLLQAGVSVLSDAELLAVLLRVGSVGCSAVDNARSLLQQQQRVRIDSATDLLPMLHMQFAGESVEVLYAALLDSNNQLLKLLPISRGSLSHHTVYARELAKLALQYHAAAVILAHNHPSGSLQVSQADKDTTEVLQAALQLLDIRLLDHLIVTPQGCRSVFLA